MCNLTLFVLFSLQGPAQAMNIRDSLAEIKSDIVVKVNLHTKTCLRLGVSEREEFDFLNLVFEGDLSRMRWAGVAHAEMRRLVHASS